MLRKIKTSLFILNRNDVTKDDVACTTQPKG